jgi:hypothetical protein
VTQRERAAERRRAARLERERAAQELLEQKRAAEERARQEQERAAEELARQLEELAAKERIRQEQDREDREWAAARRARLEREREEAEEQAAADGAAWPAEPFPIAPHPNSNGTAQPAQRQLASFAPIAPGPTRAGSPAPPRPREPEAPGRRRYRMPAMVAVAAVVLATGSLVGTKLATSGHNTAGNVVGTPTMNKAAAWVAQQVSAVVSCDPTMCLVLRAHGVPTDDLLAFEPKTRNPFGSAQIVVATPAIRHEAGSRLTAVYAPAVLASFGSGKSEIGIRVITSDGRAYLSQLKEDQQDRKTNGALLVGTGRIATSVSARAQLAAGLVDSRLMIVISSLAAVVNQVDVTGFGDSGPGASPGMPLRSATLTGSRASLRSIAAYLRTPEAPYRPSHLTMTQQGGKPALTIEFPAPIPLELFDNPSQ